HGPERPGALALNLVDPPMRHVPAIRRSLMARVLVVPVDNVDRAVRAPAHVNRSKVLVAANEKIGSMTGDKRRAAAFQDVALDAATVNAAHEHAVLVLGGDVVALHDQDAGVRPAALLM